jgi:hypothetical protein
VDYLFHLADSYCNKLWESRGGVTRYELVQYAFAEYKKIILFFHFFFFSRMGPSIISGALTTIASGSMLIFCVIQIFSKFGIIISINLSLAVLFTLTIFSSMLMIAGPRSQKTNLWFWVQKGVDWWKQKKAGSRGNRLENVGRL